MKKLKELVEYKYQKINVFGTAYNFYIERIFDQWCKGRSIKEELDAWEDNAKAVILGDIYKRHSQFLEFNFGEEYLDSKIANNILMLYKAERFEHLKGHSIYCDESMNFRKVLITQNNKEELKHTFFVLGGVIVPDEVDLRNALSLFPDHDSGEFKYRYFSKRKNMPDCLLSERLTLLFDFMLDNNIKIHFNAENYLFYSFADIIDSIMECSSFEESWEFKSCLYHFLMKSFDDTYDTLIEFEYPSIPKGKENDFLQAITRIYKNSFLNNCKNGDQQFIPGFLLLNYLEKILVSELPFLSDNTPFLLEDTLMYEYLHTATIFINNGVNFDIEQKIQEDLSDIEIDYLDKLNCTFVDSKTSLAVQFSDVVSGFVARLMKYITSLSENKMSEFIETIKNNIQIKNNLKKFLEIYQKSSDYYVYSICAKMSKYEKLLFDRFLSLVPFLN